MFGFFFFKVILLPALKADFLPAPPVLCLGAVVSKCCMLEQPKAVGFWGFCSLYLYCFVSVCDLNLKCSFTTLLYGHSLL